MPEYHVGASDISGRIYAGEGKKDDFGICWGAYRSDVTSEAINAVMAHMLYRIKNAKMDDTYDKYSFAYANKTRDGRYLRLKLEVADTKHSWLDEGREKNDQHRCIPRRNPSEKPGLYKLRPTGFVGCW